MFRRKRSRSTPPIRAPNKNLVGNATPSAASAAAVAFLNKQAADASLSSAAAATALRSHATTPEPVANLRTKGMIRRGSYGSPHGSLRQPFSSDVQRRGSTAAMPERSFRSPSPGGPTNSVPPLPADVPPIPQRSHLRTSSQDANRVTSPTPSNIGRPITGAVRPQSAIQPQRQSVTPAATSAAQKAPSSATNSPRSVNFSRPMSPPPAPSVRMFQEKAKARPASAHGFRPTGQNTGTPRVASGSRPASSSGVQGALTAATLAALPTHTDPRDISRAGFAPGTASSSNPAPPTQVAPLANSVPAQATTTQRPAQPTPQQPTPTARPQSPPIQNSNNSELNVQKRGTATAAAPRPAAVGTSSVTAIPPPTAEQIRSFQTRAAAHLARPLSQAIEPVSQPVPQITKRSASTAVKPTLASNTTNEHSRSVSQPMAQPLHIKVGRASSISPSRSAHFLETPQIEAVKHQPLPRAASPAKSAMKSSSPAPKSPLLNGSTLSDTSDTRSVASDEGSTTTQKRRKSAKVSFDEVPAVVGEAATPQTPVDATLSPQYRKSAGENWNSEDHKMTPRPALPSFGSVRGTRTPDRSVSPPEIRDGPAPARESIPAATTAIGLATSSDHGPGAVLSHDFATKHTSGSAQSETSDVPSISVVPATPKLGNENRELETAVTAPSAPDMDQMLSASNVSNVVKSHPKEPSQNLAEGTAAGYESDDPAEHFEDANEDQIDPEEAAGGFASLDAILESPQAEAAPAAFGTIDQQSKAANAGITEPQIGMATIESVPVDGEDWDQVRAYWSGLSEQTKEQLEQEAQRAREEKKAAAASQALSDGPAAKDVNVATPSSDAQLPPWPDKAFQKNVAPAPVKTALKSSVRASGHQRAGSEPTHLKSSLRTSGSPAGLRTSMRERPNSGHFSKPAQTARPQSNSAFSASATATTLAAAAMAKQTPKPALSRTLSNDSSTSESSFRRKRRNNKSDSGSTSMRRTMRATAEPQPGGSEAEDSRPTSPATSRYSRMSLRSPSPSMRKPMGHSLRGSVDSTAMSLRNGDARASKDKGSSFLGFGRSKPKNKQPVSSKPTGGFRSRFADSSDEEDDGAFNWRSRLDDSDSDERTFTSASQLRPVRGIPRHKNHISTESTDLSDSDDGGIAGRMGAPAAAQPVEAPSTPVKTNGANGNIAQSHALRAGTLREVATAPSSPSQGKSRRGLFGFGRKRTDTSASSISASPALATVPAAAPATSIPGTPTKEVNLSNEISGPSTPNTAPTQPPATADAAASIPAASTMRPTTANSERGSRLFRRFSSSNTVASAATRDDFPFAPPPIPQEYLKYIATDRPMTSDGTSVNRTPSFANGSVRPGMPNKRDSTMTTKTVPAHERPVIVSERTGKKKKFQGLRRILGVHD